MTPAGIEPATFQFVAQHLNHCATFHIYNKLHALESGEVHPYPNSHN